MARRRLTTVLAAVAICLAAAAAASADGPADALIHADVARSLGYTGKGVTVAVIDTGIDDHNPDVSGAVVGEHCIVPPDGCPDGTGEQDGPGSAQDDHGHGTAVSDIIAGRGVTAPVGIAPDAKLVEVKVADRNGRTTSDQIIAGLNWVHAHHPEVRIVNVSLGSDVLLSGDCNGLSSTLSQYGAAIDALDAQGALVFASSGNGGSPASMSSPACIGKAVAVGAVYSRSFGSYTAPFVCVDRTTGADKIACFSDGGTGLDLLAPGAPVDAADLGSGDSSIAGTSMAAAVASGAAADLLQADPSLTPEALEELLEITGVPIADPRNRLTAPRIDLAAALGAVLGHPIAVPAPPPDAGRPSSPMFSTSALPRADLSVRPIAFGAVALRKTATRRLVVANAGTGYLTVRVASSLDAVSVRPAKIVVPASKKRTVVLTFRPTRAGAYHGSLRLETDDPSARRIALELRGSGRS